MDGAPGSGQVLYLYGVVPNRHDSRRDPLGTEGNPPAAVRLLTHSQLSALVEAVPAAEFAPEALEEKLKQVEWVSGLAQRHHAVLESAMREGPVIPARLCTLFSSEEALQGSLAAKEAWLLAALERLRGKQEWSLKVFCDEARLRVVLGRGDEQAKALAEAIVSATPGVGFVLRKRHAMRLAELAAARSDEVAEEIVAAVEDAGAAVRLRALLTEAQDDRSPSMILNAALLISEAERDPFHILAEKLAAHFKNEGVSIEMKGPYPPYSFATEADAGLDDAGEGGR